jgi:hypothetical protein
VTPQPTQRTEKSLFASFSSEKEESFLLFFSEEKNQKTFICCLAGLGALRLKA